MRFFFMYSFSRSVLIWYNLWRFYSNGNKHRQKNRLEKRTKTKSVGCSEKSMRKRRSCECTSTWLGLPQGSGITEFPTFSRKFKMFLLHRLSYNVLICSFLIALYLMPSSYSGGCTLPVLISCSAMLDWMQILNSTIRFVFSWKNSTALDVFVYS